jgi:hypothetical protein
MAANSTGSCHIQVDPARSNSYRAPLIAPLPQAENDHFWRGNVTAACEMGPVVGVQAIDIRMVIE